MANKNQLLAIAKNLGIDADIKWKKAEIQEAIDRVEAEIAALEAEKADEPEPEPEPEPEQETEPEKTVKVQVGIMEATVSAGPDGELGTDDDKVEITPMQKPAKVPEPEPAPPPKPSPVVPPKPVMAPARVGKDYKCLYDVDTGSKVYVLGDTIRLTDEQAAPLKAVDAIGPIDDVQAKKDRANMLPAGDYVLICDLCGDTLITAGSTITCTAEQADLYEKIGAIKPR